MITSLGIAVGILVTVLGDSELPQVPLPVCGYESCPPNKKGFINLHIVTHSHNDVGWLNTVNIYFEDKVRKIIDSAVEELSHDVNKRFIYVELAYFWKWWQWATDASRQIVKELVNRGQLEFIGGGWSMNDEAASHYQSIIDQFTWGFKRLEDIFGKCGRPRIGWQIDPFGHSRENAAIMARMGFDGVFIGRIDHEDFNIRKASRTMEMIWHTSANDNSEASKLFTGVLYNLYFPPKGFCFESEWDDCTDSHINDLNIEQKVSDFLNQMTKYTAAYRTDNILVTVGSDFPDAHKNFKNMDKLIKRINDNEGIQHRMYAFYSTPSCYLKSVHNSQKSFPVKTDDFMPYSSSRSAFWTGYYTSRPASKRFERTGNNFLQVIKQLHSLGGIPTTSGITVLREAMGVFQHHDAITGTEVQFVADDYHRMLANAITDCYPVSSAALSALMGAENYETFESCPLLNISSCTIAEDEESFVVTLYNPLSRHVSPLVKLPAPRVYSSYVITSSLGTPLEYDVLPLPEQVVNIPERLNQDKAQLMFIAPEIPPLGFKSFYIKRTNIRRYTYTQIKKHTCHTSIGYGQNLVVLDCDGLPQSVLINGKSSFMELSFGFYNSMRGYTNKEPSSGAYIFRPDGDLNRLPKPQAIVYRGSLVTEVHFKFNNYISSILRLIKRESPFYMEHEWLVGPIEFDIPNDAAGTEVVVDYTFKDLHNKGEFKTDSNGREMILRRLNYRPTWNVSLDDPIAGNYYPVTSRISIEDGEKVWSVVTDRSEGGSSLRDGQIELMLHRRLLHDDTMGLREALNEFAFGEPLVARGFHYIVPGKSEKAKFVAQEKHLDSWIFLSKTKGQTFSEWRASHKMKGSGLTRTLPDEVQILTLEPWRGESTYLLRLEHIMEKFDGYLSPVVVTLNDLFAHWNIVSVEEMTLGANQKVSELNRFSWKEDGTNGTMDLKSEREQPRPDNHFKVTLNPMEIRTFIVSTSTTDSRPIWLDKWLVLAKRAEKRRSGPWMFNNVSTITSKTETTTTKNSTAVVEGKAIKDYIIVSAIVLLVLGIYALVIYGSQIISE